MARLEFRSTTERDEPGIVALLQQILGMGSTHPMLQPQHLRWKYWEPRADWPDARSYVLERAGQIVAHGALIPGACECAGKRYRILQVIDWAALPGIGGSGVALMKRLGQMTDALIAVDGSEATMQILPIIGFESHGQATWYTRPVRPLRRLMESDRLNWRLVPHFVRSALWTLGAPAARATALRASRVTPEQLESLPLPWPASKFGSAVLERSAAMMSYTLRCPACRFELYAVENDSRPCGYFLLAFAPAQARIADCWMDSPDVADWRAMIELAVMYAKRDPTVGEVVSIASDSLLASALSQCGFRGRKTRPLFLRVNGAVRLPLAPIRFQMVDGDLAYLHDGRAEFWA